MESDAPAPRARVHRGALVLAGGAALALLFLLDPATSLLFPSCPFHALTGLSCAGCGTTRALHALLHGQLREALRFNPLAVAALPVVAVLALLKLRRPEKPLPRAPLWAVVVLGAVALAYTVARNLG